MEDYSKAEVFGGGAGKGFYLLGYLRAKEELGLDKEESLKIGVSIGSFLVPVMSLGIPSREVKEYLIENRKTLQNVLRAKPTRVVPAVMGLFGKNGYHSFQYPDSQEEELEEIGLSQSGNLEKIARGLVGDKKFKDLKDLRIVVSNIRTLEPIVLSYENFPDLPVYIGMSMSAAVPPFSRPYRLGKKSQGVLVMDGGLSNNVPLDVAVYNNSVRNITCIDFMHVSSEKPLPVAENPLQEYFLLSTFPNANRLKGFFEWYLNVDYAEAARVQTIHTSLDGGKTILYHTPDIHHSRLSRFDTKNINELSEQGYKESLLLLEESYTSSESKPF